MYCTPHFLEVILGNIHGTLPLEEKAQEASIFIIMKNYSSLGKRMPRTFQLLEEIHIALTTQEIMTLS